MMELLERIKAGATWMPGFNTKPIPPRLSVLARFIQETWPELVVTLKPWTESTDRKIGRLCWPGAGRKGKSFHAATTSGRRLPLVQTA